MPAIFFGIFMLDLKWILSNLDHVQKTLARRGKGVSPQVFESLIHWNDRRKQAQTRFDELRAQQNQASLEIQKLQKSGGDPAPLIAEMHAISEKIKNGVSAALAEAEREIEKIVLMIPNLPHASVPEGSSEAENQQVRSWGEKPSFSFAPRQHWEIGEKLDILDFERGTKITGARFTLYKGFGAQLERALINFMLDVHTREHGYTEVLPPFLVNEQSLIGTGQLPKFEEDLFKTTMGYYLIPTAEVPVTNIHRDEILKEADLPISYTAYTPCFRSEAGSYGKDVRGLVRQHQFNKIELVKFTTEEASWADLEALTGHAETILKKLGLHYRTMALCAGDMGFSSAKTYDIEVWLPGQNAYREISSCSNFEAFQARRAKIRYKGADGKNRFVHTLNGSGLAVGRTLIAILENYQQADGSVLVPEVLRSYLGGLEKIS